MNEFMKLGRKYDVTKFQGDRFPGQTFEDIYLDILAPYREVALTVLEIGIQGGGSLRVWRDYFPHARIVGTDIDKKTLYTDDRIETFLIDQSNIPEMEKLVKQYGGFDIVIDDGGHYSTQQIKCLRFLFPYTKYVYCIEDLDTSYPDLYPELNDKGKPTLMDQLKVFADMTVVGTNSMIRRMDFRKRFCALYK